MPGLRVAVAGGGAAGFFGAIACAEASPQAEVVLFEKSPEFLAKVAISGGGRCNVTHACFDPQKLSTFYPRGGRELLGSFHRWQPRDTVEWFEERGVALKTEDDGRIFPTTDNSATIVECLLQAARSAGVQLRRRVGLEEVKKNAGGGFDLSLTQGTWSCDRLLLATGGNKATAGFGMAASLGHTIVPPVPSLFTFHIDDPRLRGLEGLSVQAAEVFSVDAPRRVHAGPVLVTHWGLSGPAVLKLSAWAARELHDRDYDFELNVNWLGGYELQRAEAELEQARVERARQAAATHALFGLPQRLWERMVMAAGMGPGTRWSGVSNAALRALAGELTQGRYHVRGKSLFKEEFVTAGGVALKEVDFRTMESKVCPGLHLAGEVLDIDGVTGGFNLQAAWTTGMIAGKAMGS